MEITDRFFGQYRTLRTITSITLIGKKPDIPYFGIAMSTKAHWDTRTVWVGLN